MQKEANNHQEKRLESMDFPFKKEKVKSVKKLQKNSKKYIIIVDLLEKT